jgi:broad specificity phosphatase PhoE
VSETESNQVLTNHGHEQANKLRDHLAKTGIILTHIFASPLTRTSKTAEAVKKAHVIAHPNTADSLEIVKVSALIEQVCTIDALKALFANRYQDFGYYEGKSFQARSADSKKTGREAHRDKHKDDEGFVDVESKESMAKRADHFLDHHLLPLFDSELATNEHTVAIVSHGILLSNLWRRLLLRLPRKSLTIALEVMAARGDITLEHLGGWSNTGYLHLSIRRDDDPKDSDAQHTSKSESSKGTPTALEPNALIAEDAAAFPLTAKSEPPETEPDAVVVTGAPRVLYGYSTKILAIDNKQHLIGLKRQRGGIGRSAHDESQKKLDGFFKKERAS